MLGTIPYVCMMLLMVARLIMFPGIALFLPNALQ
jgi:TRAP-type mannitol/chloroaromatic compound transport system permease large subunit